MSQPLTAPPPPTQVTVSRAIPRSALFPARDVVAEVKPHSREGIRDGLDQLRKRLAPGARTARPVPGRTGGPLTPHLITYRRDTTDPTRFLVRILSGATLRIALRTKVPPADVHFRPLGTIVFPGAVTPMPLWRCPALLGNEMEPKVRYLYQQWLGQVQGHPLRLDARAPQAPGADIEHELAEFLTELGTLLARPQS